MDTGKLIAGAGALAAVGAGIWYVKKKGSTDTFTIPGTVADEFVPQMEETPDSYFYVPDTGEVIKPIVAEQEYSDTPTQSYVAEEQIPTTPETATTQTGKTPVDPNVMVKMITALYIIQDEKKRKAAAFQMAAALRSLSVADQKIVLARTVSWYNSLAAAKKQEVINLFESIGLKTWANTLSKELDKTIVRAESAVKKETESVAKQVLIDRAKTDYKAASLAAYKEQKATFQKQEQNNKEAVERASILQAVSEQQDEVAKAENNKETPTTRVIPQAIKTIAAPATVKKTTVQAIVPSSASTTPKTSFVAKVVQAVKPAATTTKTFTAPTSAATVTRAAPLTASTPVNTPAELAAFNSLRAMFNALPVTSTEKFQYVRIKAAFDSVAKLPVASKKKVLAGYAKWMMAQPISKRKSVNAIIQKIAVKYPYLRRLAA